MDKDIAIEINGKDLSFNDLLNIAESKVNIHIAPNTWIKIIDSYDYLDEAKLSKKIYGLNTGIGSLISKTVNSANNRYQEKILYSHATGFGDFLEPKIVRAAIASRINVLSKGLSGCSPELVKMLVTFLNKGITPQVHSEGSVGASGDLPLMSEIGLCLLGKGKVYYNNEVHDTQTVLKSENLKPLVLKNRDGLALINGSNVILAKSVFQISKIQDILNLYEAVISMSIESLQANPFQFDEFIFKERGYDGGVVAINKINGFLEGSDLYKRKYFSQNAYSLRTIPQILGIAYEALINTKKQIEIEINSLTDNPIIGKDNNEVLLGANFQSAPFSFPLEYLGSILISLTIIAERIMNQLLNENLNNNLPAYLAKNPGVDSGFMILQVNSGYVLTELKQLAIPSHIFSSPSCSDQEDYVSMGLNTTNKIERIIDGSHRILANLFIICSQALDFRNVNVGSGVRSMLSYIRRHIPFYEDNTPLNELHEAMYSILKNNLLINEIRKFENEVINENKI